MYLRRMEVVGFKSFAARTVLEFHDGITVVVGPNGCGKSNVLDSIRWALGEQSPKTLRGQNMADIIFNGTQSEPPANYAEVTLVFDNTCRSMDIAYDEVSITRKLFRDGTSEYYLNKSQVRLKEIHALLLSVGLGEGSYSFVMQGTIERILTQKPEQKRVIFDEAAGILQYKEKKREVERKLQETEDNLARVEDIVIEVKRQRDAVGRQVQRAQKYQELNEELQSLEKNLAVVKVKNARSRLDGLLDSLNVFSENERANRQRLDALSKEHGEKEQVLAQLREKHDDLNRHVITLESKVQNNKGRIETFKQRIAESNERVDNIEGFKGQYNDRCQQQNQRIEQLKVELTELEHLEIEAGQRVDSIAAEIDLARKSIEESGILAESFKQKIDVLEEEKSRLNGEIHSADNKIQSFSARIGHINKELEKNNREIQSYNSSRQHYQQQMALREEEITRQRELFTQKQQALSQLMHDLENTQEALSEKDKELVRLNTRMDFLKNMDVSYQVLPYDEEATITFSKQLPELPAVLISKIEEAPSEDGSGNFRISTRVKAISASIDTLNHDIEDIKAAINMFKNNIGQARDQRGQLQKEIDVQIDMIREREKELSRIGESLNNIAYNVERTSAVTAQLESEKTNIEAELAEYDKKKQELNWYFGEKAAAVEKVITELDAAVSDAAQKNQKLNQLEVEQAQLRTRLTTIEAEKAGKSENIRIFISDLESMSGQFEVLGREESELRLRLGEFDKEITVIEEENKGIMEQALEGRKRLQDISTDEKDLFAQRMEIDRTTRQIEAQLDELKNNTYAKKLELQNIKHEEDQVCRDMLQLYDIEVTVEQLLAKESTSVPLEEMLVQEEELIRRLKYLGTVNLDAPREYEELNTRYEFLESQKDDIIQSRENLKKALRKINSSSKEIFIETFEQVTSEFREMFKFLFGGGKADVVLLDPENVLESGVDIIVQPPGKKLQNVSLLSGGEKSMTAIALIFAIFKVKPSPLCILDEIDAALDEANVDRYNHVLREFASSSQFLVISHNKRTISVADVLYGVTMQQSGMSNIVSVRLTDETESPVRKNRLVQRIKREVIDLDSLLDDTVKDDIIDSEQGAESLS